MDWELAHTALATSWHHFTWPPPQHQATQRATGELTLLAERGWGRRMGMAMGMQMRDRVGVGLCVIG